MSSTEKQAEVATQQADEVISSKEKGSGDVKTEKSPQKRPASEVNDDAELKQKVQKTDRKGEKKENGEAEDKYDEGAEDDGGDDDDDDAVADGDDYDEEGDDPEGDDPEDGAEDDDEDDDA